MMPRIERIDGPSGTATRNRSSSIQATSPPHAPASSTSMASVRKTRLLGMSRRTRSQFFGSYVIMGREGRGPAPGGATAGRRARGGARRRER
jgi:hypothetical protein